MAYYSNEQSLKATFGDNEVAGLLSDAPGTESAALLGKAAGQAFSEINGYLRSGGYVVPIVPLDDDGNEVILVAYGEEGSNLDGSLQAVSDDFTAWHLASSQDKQKKRYDDGRAQGLVWLDKVRNGQVQLPLKRTAAAGAGDFCVLTRPRVFCHNAQNERRVLRRNRG